MPSPNLRVQRVPIDSLTPDPANARRHSERNIEAIRGSLRRFGQQRPILVSPVGVVIAGNGALAAAKAEGWTEIEVMITTLNGAEATAFAIADNRTAELAGWDEDALAAQLRALHDSTPDLAAACGFNATELEAVLGAFAAQLVDAPDLASGDREPFRQMTFTLHDEQHDLVARALSMAKAAGGAESDFGPNSNANALAFICNDYIERHG